MRLRPVAPVVTTLVSYGLRFNLEACSAIAYPNGGETPWSVTHAVFVALGTVAEWPYLLFWAPAFSAATLLIVLGCRFMGDSRGNRSLRVEVVFVASLVLVVLLFRWPLLVVHEQNPDESVEIASALTLLHDPVYWRSVDCETLGPLTTAPLLLPPIIGVRIDYGSAKLMSLVLQLCAILFIYSILRRLFNPSAAGIAVIPLTLAIALLRDPSLLAYLGEPPLIALMAAAGYGLALLATSTAPRMVVAAITAFALGCIPYVKMQGVPMGVALGVGALIIVSFHGAFVGRRRLAWTVIIFGALMPTIANTWICAHFGLLGDFIQRYVVSQLFYPGSAELGFSAKLAVFMNGWVGADRSVARFLSISLLQIVVLILVVGYRVAVQAPTSENEAPRGIKRRVSSMPVTWLGGIGLALVLVILGALVAWIPTRGFRHYYALCLFANSVLLGFLFCVLYESLSHFRQRRIAVSLLILPFVFSLALQREGPLRVLPWEDSRVVPPPRLNLGFQRHRVSNAVLQYGDPGEGLVIWGWMDQYHVETRMIYGIRTKMQRLFGFGNQEYYIESFVRELKENQPPVLIDVVTESSFYFTDRKHCGMQIFPAIAEHVKDNYRFVREVDGVHIYLSLERARELGINARIP